VREITRIKPGQVVHREGFKADCQHQRGECSHSQLRDMKYNIASIALKFVVRDSPVVSIVVSKRVDFVLPGSYDFRHSKTKGHKRKELGFLLAPTNTALTVRA
jgi:hypothetical protein